MTKAGQFVEVSERGLVQRLRRALDKQGERLLVDRMTTRYYTVNAQNKLMNRDVDIVKLGRSLGVLKPWERLEGREA